MKVFNCFRQEVRANSKRLASPGFGYYDKNGVPHPYWKEEDEVVDSRGFLKTYSGTDGYYDIIELPKGTMLCRYGAPYSDMTALKGTAYDELSLPYDINSIEYHEYEVITDGVFVRCIVKRGIVAPMFDSPGGAVQFQHERIIQAELETGRLREDMQWLVTK